LSNQVSITLSVYGGDVDVGMIPILYRHCCCGAVVHDNLVLLTEVCVIDGVPFHEVALLYWEIILFEYPSVIFIAALLLFIKMMKVASVKLGYQLLMRREEASPGGEPEYCYSFSVGLKWKMLNLGNGEERPN
jgi:hypothetical protein